MRVDRVWKDRVESQQEAFDKLKHDVRDIFKDYGKAVSPGTTYDDFVALLTEALEQEGSGAPEIKSEHEKKALHDHMVERAKKKVRRKEEDYEDGAPALILR